ncbi:MAG: GTPase [Aphanizomenon flos-aquae LD13]|jgi:GTPase Era involved in 16S rRNA processing|uniref:GTPase n=1 Tax=Aphanizomenon flos-aquae LD13 TaxID=1710894 RepID=A0A1B7VJM4_APHFL|nr:GTPase [Aphanizomenon flos-aquae UKL13-PB]OBQ19386.1 MAG: GTPase [Aphanizomenon flos-aquae LD13]HCQ22284.1 GTPase [Anabaena sp. UBA12330]
MSNSVYKVFEEIEFKAKLLAQYWDNFHTEISQHLPESYQSEIQELSNNLEIALNQLIYELQNPTLTLATTGTTSSGKSTLVNLLCGAEIVPVAVSEMSAGAVTIEYSKEKSLIIKETPGALWECGEWRGISDDKIYQRLYQAMISYIENRETQPNLACPQSIITYPFRLLKESQLQLPKATRVRILDLPGLAYVGDQGNANVIKQCREALCIVTYNSAETDSQKVKSLLQEVVQQVKDLGGSPARMLFALNRIDVFRADRNWPETENRFVEKAIRDIKNELTEQLKEYTEDIENLKVVKLSTWPALLSLQIQNQDDIYSADACKKADNHFNGLIEDILEDLPRNTQRWNRHEKNRVAQALWQKSYAEEFQQNLREHINKHFPQLVIPQIIERFNIAAGNAIAEWATQTTNAVLNSSEEKYQQECENIAQIRSEIKRFLKTSDTNLREPFERIDTKIKQVIAEQLEDDPVRYLEETLSEFKKVEPYNLLGEKLIALYDWRRQLGQGITQVLEAVAKSLESGRVDLESTNLKKANLLNVNLLGRNLNRLVNLGYTGSVAKEGKTMEARTDSEKNQLKQINEELNELAIHLNIVMEDVLTQISDQELKRMDQAIEELFNCHLSHIEKGANDKAPNIAIKFPESQLIIKASQLTFNFRFEAGFPINKGTWQEAVQVEKKKRTWYTLWIGKKTFYETEYRTRSSDNAEIPSVENLLTSWVDQSRKEEREIVNKIASWLLEKIDCLKKNVDKLQNDIIDRYQARLDKANQEITLDYEKQRNVWLPMQKKAQELAENFSSLETVLK